MTERPILFSPPMVKAILEGRKTQTRRVANTGFYAIDESVHGQATATREREKLLSRCPQGVPGDRLWVREALYLDDENKWRRTADKSLIELDADDERVGYMLSWAHHKETARCPSMHMPRFASRITLEVTGVRVERVQEISEHDAIAEGIERERDGFKAYETILAGPHRGERHPHAVVPNREARTSYRELWNWLNAKRGFGWDKNPWVWVVEFKRLPA